MCSLLIIVHPSVKVTKQVIRFFWVYFCMRCCCTLLFCQCAKICRNIFLMKDDTFYLELPFFSTNFISHRSKSNAMPPSSLCSSQHYCVIPTKIFIVILLSYDCCYYYAKLYSVFITVLLGAVLLIQKHFQVIFNSSLSNKFKCSIWLHTNSFPSFD